MSVAIINSEIKALSHAEKLQVLQELVQELILEKELFSDSNNKGKQAAGILQRMADRNALPHITDPAKWQQEIRQDRVLPGRD